VTPQETSCDPPQELVVEETLQTIVAGYAADYCGGVRCRPLWRACFLLSLRRTAADAASDGQVDRAHHGQLSDAVAVGRGMRPP